MENNVESIDCSPDQLLLQLIEISDEIDQRLALGDKIEPDTVAELTKIYARRKKILNRLVKFFASEAGKNYLFLNSALWNKNLLPIIKKDVEQVEKINSSVKIIGNELKNLMKQKSLLLYSKGKYNEYR